MPNNFSDTAKGKIVIGVAIACIVGILGHVSGRLIAPALPPIAKLSPNLITVDAGQFVEFDAGASNDPANEELIFDWKISGHPIDRSSVGHCNQGAISSLVSCIFTTPGTFSVSSIVKNSSGLTSSATAPVTVQLKDGFIGLYLKLGTSGTQRDNAYRAILQVIDWPSVQQHVSRPIILYNPDVMAPVFAASITYNSNATIDGSIANSLAGATMIVPQFRAEAMKIIDEAVGKLGGRLLVMRLADAPFALTAGRSNNGFSYVSSFADFRHTLDTGEFK